MVLDYTPLWMCASKVGRVFFYNHGGSLSLYKDKTSLPLLIADMTTTYHTYRRLSKLLPFSSSLGHRTAVDHSNSNGGAGVPLLVSSLYSSKDCLEPRTLQPPPNPKAHSVMVDKVVVALYSL